MNGETVEIGAGDARATIALRGAELRSWRAGGSQLLWSPQPHIWDRVSPFLFPVVGWCRDGRIRVDGKSYPMGVHGFAADCDFAVEDKGRSHVSFVLRDNTHTRAHYPFGFEFRIAYSLEGPAISITIGVKNVGESPLPYACGVHPGFRWPFAEGPRDAYAIEFETVENAVVPVIAPGGLFSSAVRPVPLNGRRLVLSDALFAHEALCFLNARSRALKFVGPGGQGIAARFESMPHLALWSKPGAPFVCLEAWTGHGDPVGFDGELGEKPSMRVLEPNEEGRHAAVFEWV